MGKDECSKKYVHFMKIKELCAKYGKIKNLETKTIKTDTLESNSIKTSNLEVTTINGQNFDCLNKALNISGTITPIIYENGEPKQPENPGNFNQKLLDQLWNLNKLANSVTNLDAAYGRLRTAILNNFYNCSPCPETTFNNCACPIPNYAVFQGTINGNLLTVTTILNTSYTSCPPSKGTIKLGQRIYGQTNQFLNSTIVNQVSGAPGDVGVYTIMNNLNDYSNSYPNQVILSISDIGLEECAAIPMQIYGVETLSVGPVDCGKIVSSISYNINIANKTLGTKLAAVYVQIGYVDINGIVKTQGLSIDTKQFDNSILSYGEQMNNTVFLPTELVNQISFYNSFGNEINAVIQLAVYIEDGLEVFIPESSSSRERNTISKREINANASNTNNFSVSYNDSSNCAVSNGSGTIEGFIQPNVGETVTLPAPNFFLSDPSYGNLFFNNGYYIILNSFPNSNLILLFTGSSPIYYPPGTQLPSGIANSYKYIARSEESISFIQPPVGGIITITLCLKTSCQLTGSPILDQQVVYLTGKNTPKIGFYNIIKVTPVDDPQPVGDCKYVFQLMNTTPTNTPSGTNINDIVYMNLFEQN